MKFLFKYISSVTWKISIFVVGFFCFFSLSVEAQSVLNRADSIMNLFLDNRDLYGKYIQEYDAEVYLKGSSFVKKKNILMRLAPSFLYLDKKGNDNFTESFIDIHFQAPNHFTQQIKALNGSRLSAKDIQNRVMQFLNINIQNPTLFNDHILLPGKKDVYKYYRFEYITGLDTLGHHIHKIKIIPIVKSQKLISGYFYITDKLWSVAALDIKGKYEFSDFRLEIFFGMPEKRFLLPVESKITFNLDLLGNEVTNEYYSSFNYTSVRRYKDEKGIDLIKDKYDLSSYYNVQLDSLPIIKDEAFWENKRPLPITEQEKSLIKAGQSRLEADSLVRAEKDSWSFSQGILEPTKMQYNDTKVDYSGLLNPFKLSYSKNGGLSYWQKLRLRKDLKNGKELSFTPNIGFVFKDGGIFYNTPIGWVFNPQKMGSVNFNFGNKNQSYNSTIINQINEEIPDSINFDDFELEYYRHYHIELHANYELCNGLLLQGGIDYDWYDPVRKEDAGESEADFRSEKVNEDVVDIISKHYLSFAPVAKLTWTPGRYYRINGKRKEYLHSNYPTFSIEYARGIKGFLDGNSDYERIEIDAQQRIPLSLMHSFQYYIGGGIFTNTESIYFADFKNFARRNFPQSWDDPIGGVFHLLDGEWYNAANSYVQLHLMYESPFALLKLFRGVSNDIINERIYVSQLYTPVLPCYTEVGFGVGNFLGNVGVFTSWKKARFDSFGLKAVFELK